MVADDQQPEWLEHLSVLRLEPGDVVVIRSSERLPREGVERIQWLVSDVLQKAYGREHKVMVLDHGLDIGVIRGGSDA